MSEQDDRPADRDRDERGRPRNARPRDALGRPLRYGAEGVPRQEENPPRTPEQALAQAQLLLDAGRPFEAHEVLEDAWKAAPADERELWRGLAQLAVGLTHAARGNRAGSLALIARGAANLAAFADRPPHGIDVRGLLAWSAAVAEPAPDAGATDTSPDAGATDTSPDAVATDTSPDAVATDTSPEAARLRPPRLTAPG